MNSALPYTIVGLGELLWDLLPGGRQLGGAPANFAYHAALLGDDGIIASRIGEDDLGRDAASRIESIGLGLDHIQLDPEHPTGTVNIEIDGAGQPSYTIVQGVAWDFIAWDHSFAELARRADAVCFGSLAQRSETARGTIRRFLANTRDDCVRVFDVNLRQAFYSGEVLAASLELATAVKLNEEELPEVLKLLGQTSTDPAAGALELIEAHSLKLVCVTRGENGSLLATESEVADHPGFEVAVADAVGAGDAFTAAMTHHLLRRAPLTAIGEAANRMGAWVASRSGATPKPDPPVIGKVLSPES